MTPEPVKRRKRPEPKPALKPVFIQALSIEALIALCRVKPGLLRALSSELQAAIEARLKWTA